MASNINVYPLFHTLTLTLTHTLTHSQTHTHTHTLSLTLTLTLTLIHTHTHTHSLSLLLTHSITHSHSHILFIYLSVYLFVCLLIYIGPPVLFGAPLPCLFAFIALFFSFFRYPLNLYWGLFENSFTSALYTFIYIGGCWRGL